MTFHRQVLGALPTWGFRVQWTGERMRKAFGAVLVGCMLALVFASASVASADESEPLRGGMQISIDLSAADLHWEGPLTGDIEGTIQFWEHWDENYVVGGTEHFFETFIIMTDRGTITGMDAGVWNLATFKFRANGWVTDATGDWAYLVGYKMHEIGTTTAFPPPPGSTTVSGTATMFLAQP